MLILHDYLLLSLMIFREVLISREDQLVSHTWSSQTVAVEVGRAVVESVDDNYTLTRLRSFNY